MSNDGIRRRDLLLGRLRPKRGPIQGTGFAAPEGSGIDREDRKLPDVIAWLDPDMRGPARGPATRGQGDVFPLLRPPGALAEGEFRDACTKCGDCETACPHAAIRPAPARLREAEGTPFIDPIEAPCLLCEDLPCISACEAGALRPEAPAALGTARIQTLDCLNQLGSPCSVCAERCPVPGAITLHEGMPVIEAPLCTGCGICQNVCPAPHNAVVLLPNPERPTRAQIEARQASEATFEVAPEPAPEIAEEIQLPPLHEGLLDVDQLHALARDLEAVAEVFEVRTKGAPRGHSSAEPLDLMQAMQRLESGEVRGVQVSYCYQDEVWCDTILALSTGFRVLRMATPEAPEPRA
jgi:MauM/NapG family ferredoxin protein